MTKPLGTGILGSALKKNAIDVAGIAEAVRWMTALNADAARAMLSVGVHAATDVTGFGLLGHGAELAQASGVGLKIDAASVPLLGGVLELIDAEIAPSGTHTNAEEHAAYTEFTGGIAPARRLVLSDAQTSGGLLIAVTAERAGALRDALLAGHALAAEIGRVVAGAGIVVA